MVFFKRFNKILVYKAFQPRFSSSNLSKYAPLPQIGAKITKNNYNSELSLENSMSVISTLADNKNKEINLDTSLSSVLIGLRLPNGTKKEKKFKNRDTLKMVMEFALKDNRHLGQPSNFTFLMMPNFIVHDLNKSIGFYKIANRSMLFVIDKNLL